MQRRSTSRLCPVQPGWFLKHSGSTKSHLGTGNIFPGDSQRLMEPKWQQVLAGAGLLTLNVGVTAARAAMVGRGLVPHCCC